jgi:hypothetical protein
MQHLTDKLQHGQYLSPRGHSFKQDPEVDISTSQGNPCPTLAIKDMDTHAIERLQ